MKNKSYDKNLITMYINHKKIINDRSVVFEKFRFDKRGSDKNNICQRKPKA